MQCDAANQTGFEMLANNLCAATIPVCHRQRLPALRQVTAVHIDHRPLCRLDQSDIGGPGMHVFH